MKDLSIDPQRGTVLSIPFLLAMIAAVEIPHWLLWRESAIRAAFNTGVLAAVLIFAAAIVAHEAIHGITWALAARLKRSEIKFGVLWSALTPYAHPKVPITARAYRIGAAMPGLVLGLLPSLAGLATGNAALSGWGAVLLSFACGDLLILLTIRSVPPGALVRDHPSRFGCEVLEPSDMVEPAATDLTRIP